jgi:endonuclease I/chitodextrinase
MLKKLLSFYVLLFITLITFSQVQPYYNDVDLTLSGVALKDALATKTTSAHIKFLDYTSSGPDVWKATKITDKNVNLFGDVILFYGWEDGSDQDITNDLSRDNRFQDIGNGDSDVWNREHVFPKSLANPILDTDIPGPATDAHHLRAADRTRNSTRNNRKYGRGTGTSKFSTDVHQGLDGPNTAAWYPGDAWKGDAARMIMYMYLRYDTVCLPTAVGVGSKKFTQDEMIDLFLQWNVEDPVSAIEIARNTYHGDTSNSAAQGNRNPFIDNPYLATRIWGGNSAEDIWDLYKSTDTEAPSTPQDLTINMITVNSMNISWSASSDNKGVTGYDVYVNGILEAQTKTTTSTISNLNTNTSYNITVVARDLINNMSAAATKNAKTLEDTEAPGIPTSVLVSNETDSSFDTSWSASADNNAVGSYEIYLDGNLNGTTTDVFYTVSNLNTATTYSVSILAKDFDNNASDKSEALSANTTSGAFNGVSELFISEYTEPEAGGGNEKAIEIVNLTGATINLSAYSIQKQSNGGSWVDDYALGDKNIVPGDVFVIVHADVTRSELADEADLFGPPNIDTSPFGFGSPLNFNGNDPIGLYKNGVLIDIIGEEGNSSNHINDKTYRRKAAISEPNTRFNLSEWDLLNTDILDGFGSHTATLSTDNVVFEAFKIFPNPTNGDKIYFNVTERANIKMYTILGKLIQTTAVTKSKNSMDISKLSTGMYLLKITAGTQFITKKLIKN